MQRFMEIYGEENMNSENFIDVLVENGCLFKRYYSKINNMHRDDIDKLIYNLTVKENYIADKVSKEKIELIDSKTGKIRYYIWSNHTVEKYFMENLGAIKSEGALLY